MMKFVDEDNKLKMADLKAIFKIAVFAIAFSSMIYIVSMIKH